VAVATLVSLATAVNIAMRRSTGSTGPASTGLIYRTLIITRPAMNRGCRKRFGQRAANSAYASAAASIGLCQQFVGAAERQQNLASGA
jgi:hypothetical protein